MIDVQRRVLLALLPHIIPNRTLLPVPDNGAAKSPSVRTGRRTVGRFTCGQRPHTSRAVILLITVTSRVNGTELHSIRLPSIVIRVEALLRLPSEQLTLQYASCRRPLSAPLRTRTARCPFCDEVTGRRMRCAQCHRAARRWVVQNDVPRVA